ncbi:hypothetical protein ACE10X_07020 [Bradyrhizobium sp. Pha-3]|uniref:hypothetical protein n=1 Tax=Bradyrhizobium sp. Pha-3 TaxID=208375 RepID=UPI0035D4B54D
MSTIRTMGELGSELPQAFKGQPSAVTAIVRAFQLEHGEAVAASRVIEDQVHRVCERREEAAKRVAELRVAVSRGIELEQLHIAKLDRQIAEANAEIESLRPRAELLSATISQTGVLLRNLENYAKAAFKGIVASLLGKPVEQPRLAKNETWIEAIEGRRRRIRELRANADKFRAAPLRSDIVLQREIERINDLAKLGAPDAFDAIERGADVKWPMFKYLEFFPVVGRIKFETGDALPLIAHLFRDQMIAAAKAAIEAVADDDAALSDADRARLVGEAERDALAVEREECALVRGAKAAGALVLFRPDADPRAVLGLADDMPPAAQR